MSVCTDRVILDLWHPLGAVDEAPFDQRAATMLLGQSVGFAVDIAGRWTAWRLPGEEPLPAIVRYGYVWSSLGDPPVDLFDLPEYAEADRRNLNGATIGVHVSAPRAIENFLDMAHFPFVHTGVLGAEPHTEVREYDVELVGERDELVATRCRMFQPKASAVSSAGAEVDYVYRVPHPYCAVLYKSSEGSPERRDVIAVFLQALDEEHIRAHMLLSVLDDVHSDSEIRNFQQTIFGQDKPILENQYPKRLPLDSRAETPIRADKSAVAYRRWLSNKGISYGVIPAAG